jgi:hypothetical protein
MPVTAQGEATNSRRTAHDHIFRRRPQEDIRLNERLQK